MAETTRKSTTKKRKSSSVKSRPRATGEKQANASGSNVSPPAGASSEQQASSVPDAAQLPSERGKVGLLGGPKDRGVKPDDKLALPTGPHFAYERVRSLNPKSFYCAMRWNYRFQRMSPEEGKRWWANKKILVTNPASGVSVVVRAVDYGPHENTGLDISISPGAAEALGVQAGDEVEIAFADQRAPLGVVR
jgi:hypothetical protein